MSAVPIAIPSDELREIVEHSTRRLFDLRSEIGQTVRVLLDWLRVEYEIATPSKVLSSPIALDSDAFVAEVKKLRGRRNPLSAAGLKGLRDEHARTIEPAQALAREADTVEHRLSDLVNEAYGLTPEEVALMWQTAPPRMPISAPMG